MRIRPLASDAGRPDGRHVEARANRGGNAQAQGPRARNPTPRPLPRQNVSGIVGQRRCSFVIQRPHSSSPFMSFYV